MPIEIRRLVSAVIIRMLQDWNKEQYREDAHAFLNSEDFAFMAKEICLNPAKVRRIVADEQFDISVFRAVYR